MTTNTRSSRDELAYYAANCAAVAAITQPSFVDTVAACLPDARSIAATATDLGASPASFSAGGVLPFDRLMGDPDRVPLRRYNPLAYNSVQSHVGHDGTAERRRLDACECPVGRADDGVASAIDRPRQGARVFSALPHELAHVRFAWQPMGRRFNRGPARVSASRFWERAIHHHSLDVHVAVRPPNARRASGPGAAFLSLLGIGDGRPLRSHGRGSTFKDSAGSDDRNRDVSPHRRPQSSRPPARHGTPRRRLRRRGCADDGTAVEYDERGRLLVKGIPGITLFYKYLNNPAATAAAFDTDGWMDTGDLATVFEDGNLRFEGRGKDMLRIGAENVATAEIERVVVSVAGVVETAVVGKPDEFLGEVAVAFVVAMPDAAGIEQRVLAACRERLADFKVPREVRLVAEFPRSTLNKISKKDLREALAVPQEEG